MKKQNSLYDVWTTVAFMFIVLKISGQVTWPWIAVLAPIWMLVLFAIVFFVVFFFLYAIIKSASLINESSKED